MLKKTLWSTAFLFLSVNTLFAASLPERQIDELVNRYFTAWTTHSIAEIGKFYADDIALYDLPADFTIKGRQAVLKYEQQAWLAAVPDMLWLKTSSIFIRGNTAAYEWLYSGTYSGRWWGKEVVKKTFSIRGISTTRFNEAGKIVFQKDFYDMNSFATQLGVQ